MSRNKIYSTFTEAELEEMRKADEEIDNMELEFEDYQISTTIDNELLFPKKPSQIGRSAINRKYYYKNRDELLEKQRAYHNANKDKVHKRQKLYYKANRDKLSVYHRAYYQKQKLNKILGDKKI